MGHPVYTQRCIVAELSIIIVYTMSIVYTDAPMSDAGPIRSAGAGQRVRFSMTDARGG